MTTLFLDLEAGNDSNDGLSFANRKKTFAGASAVAVAGDTVRIMGSPAPVSLGVNATWVKGEVKVSLASAVNADIDTGEAAWTPSANVTATTSTDRKEGATSASVAVAAGFATGLAAYKATGSLNLSGYRQISFWIKQTAGDLSANCSIRLCSDVAGVTTVDNLAIPARAVLNQWIPIVIDKGSALGTSIQSVALYIDSDLAAQTFLIDNIVACKGPNATGELTHQTALGKANSLGAGGTDTDSWYHPRAIRGTTVFLDCSQASGPGASNGSAYGRYYGTSETVAAYSQRPTLGFSSMTIADNTWLSSGTSGSHIVLSGGWDRTAMTTQNLQTHWTGIFPASGTPVGLAVFGSYIEFSRLHFWRWNVNPFQLFGTNFTVGETHIGQNLAATMNGQISDSTFSKLVFLNSGNISITGHNTTFSSLKVQTDNLLIISGYGGSVIVDAETVVTAINVSDSTADIAFSTGAKILKPTNVVAFVGQTVAAAAPVTVPASIAATGDAMTLTSGERTTLAASVWDALTSGITAVGSIGKWILDKLDVAVSTRNATTPPTAAQISTQVGSDLSGTHGAGSWATATGFAVPGSAMTLTTGERTAVANEVEAQIIDDTDSEKVLTAITDKIASVNPSLDDLTLGGIASAVRTELATELSRIDTAISTRGTGTALDAAGVRSSVGLASANLDNQLDALPTNAELAIAISGVATAASVASLGTPLQAGSYTAPDNAGITAVKVVTDRLSGMLVLDDMVYQFTANALENAVAGGGGGGDTIVIQAMATTVNERISETLIQAYYAETGWTIGPAVVLHDDGTPFDLTQFGTLKLVIEDQYGVDKLMTTDVTISGDDNNQWSAVGTSAVTAIPNVPLRWALRGIDTDVNIVLGRGDVRITEAANADS